MPALLPRNQSQNIQIRQVMAKTIKATAGLVGLKNVEDVIQAVQIMSAARADLKKLVRTQYSPTLDA
jgi:hypothetical protein